MARLSKVWWGFVEGGWCEQGKIRLGTILCVSAIWTNKAVMFQKGIAEVIGTFEKGGIKMGWLDGWME